MGAITLEFDNTLKLTDIVMPLVSSSHSELNDDYDSFGATDKAQTSVFGVQVPLIMINNTIIDFDCIKYFSLKSTGRLPELSINVEDRYQIINGLDKISQDNEVRIQILPKFDNAYKKINLTFYITSVKVIGTNVQLNAIYKIPLLTSSEFKSYGHISTYSLFRLIAEETSLGFATNVPSTDDERYIYCDNKTRLALLDNEIQYSSSSNAIMDWWIDLWNNINLADIRERYESVDPDEDIMIWIAGQKHEVTADNEVQSMQVPAVLIDHPALGQSELFVTKYTTNVKPGGQVSRGSDKLYSIYNEHNGENLEYLVQDGDIKNDIFTTYEYVGENIGEYNYMLAKSLRGGFFQKMSSDTITVTLESPLLGIMRGHKVNFIHYVNNDALENKMNSMEEAGIIDRNVESNIPLSKYEITVSNEDNGGDGKFTLDRTVSGQYLISGVSIVFTNNKWEYALTLTRPASAKPSIIK